jgi:spoIIIJ-associated protein
VAEPEGRPAPTEPGLDRERVAAIAREVGGRLLKELDVNVKTVWYEDERRPTLWVDIRGKDADSLVGHRARTLHSVQYLFRALVHPQVEDGDFNLVVDADGYRKRRRRSLRNLARKMADKVADSGQSLRLRPMPANERRIIHITLRKDGRVSTRSTGSGRKRAVTIYPEK